MKLCNINLDQLKLQREKVNIEFCREIDQIVLSAVTRTVVVKPSVLLSKFGVDIVDQEKCLIKYFSELFNVKLENTLYPFFYIASDDKNFGRWVFSKFEYFTIQKGNKFQLLKALCYVMLEEFAFNEIQGAEKAHKEAINILQEIEVKPSKELFCKFFELSQYCEYDKFSQIEFVNKLVEDSHFEA